MQWSFIGKGLLTACKCFSVHNFIIYSRPEKGHHNRHNGEDILGVVSYRPKLSALVALAPKSPAPVVILITAQTTQASGRIYQVASQSSPPPDAPPPPVTSPHAHPAHPSIGWQFRSEYTELKPLCFLKIVPLQTGRYASSPTGLGRTSGVGISPGSSLRSSGPSEGSSGCR